MSPDYTVTPLADGIEIELHPQRKPMQLLFGLGFFLIGSLNAIAFLPQPGRDVFDRIFGVIPLIFVGVGAYFLLDYWAAHFVALRSGRLLLTRRLGQLAIVRQYAIAAVRRLRQTTAPAKMHARGQIPPDEVALAFDYGNRTVYFAQAVTPEAAASLVAELGRVAPETLRAEPPYRIL